MRLKMKDVKIMIRIYGYLIMFVIGMATTVLTENVWLSYLGLVLGVVVVIILEGILLRVMKKLKGYDPAIVEKKYTYLDDEGNYRIHNDEIYEALSKLAYYEHEVEEK